MRHKVFVLAQRVLADHPGSVVERVTRPGKARLDPTTPGGKQIWMKKSHGKSIPSYAQREQT